MNNVRQLTLASYMYATAIAAPMRPIIIPTGPDALWMGTEVHTMVNQSDDFALPIHSSTNPDP